MTELTSPTKRRIRISRVLVVSIVVCLGAALVAPAAFADHRPTHPAPKLVNARHFLKMYKVTKVLDIEGDALVREFAELSCDTNGAGVADNDLATDGMYKIVDVDVDDDGHRVYTDVRAYASYSDPADPANWKFEFENLTEGPAQLKLFLTCLGWKTEPNSHQHQWDFTGPITETQTGNNGGATNHRVKAATGPVIAATGANTAAPPVVNFPVSNSGQSCQDLTPAGDRAIAVSPGFRWTSGYGDIYQSMYRNAASATGFRDWIWGFWVRPGAFSVQVSHRCLWFTSLIAGSKPHRHQFVYEFDPGYAALTGGSFNTPINPDPDGNPNQIGAGGTLTSVETKIRNCDAHGKGMVHSFDLDPSQLGQHLWFLGMDPRIKSRAYKVQNKDSVIRQAQFGLMCFEDRTNKNIK